MKNADRAAISVGNSKNVMALVPIDFVIMFESLR
jgi:hypothetical protein